MRVPYLPPHSVTPVSVADTLLYIVCVCVSMQDSNQFHACCLDTYPPVFYMNDVSKRIIAMVHHMNKVAKRTVVRDEGVPVMRCYAAGVWGARADTWGLASITLEQAAYTFDAGPNAVLYTRSADVPLVFAVVAQCFGPTDAAGERE